MTSAATRSTLCDQNRQK